MISLLSSVLIGQKPNPEDPEVRQKYGMLCGAVGIFLNLVLFAGKFFAGILSASVAIMADAFNNLSDAGSSLITLIGFKLAGQAPDLHHPFGHGRLEYISGLVVAFLILLMGAELLQTSIVKIIHPEPIDAVPLVLVILVASVCVKGYMYLYNKKIGQKIDSAAMQATALDSLSDSVSTIVVLLATLVGRYTDLMIDGWCGVLVALFILWSGINAAKDTISPLLGQPPKPEFVEKIHEIVRRYPEVKNIHDLVVHDYGPGRCMISLHAEVPASDNIVHLHDTIDNIEEVLHRELGCEAVIHMDPIVTDHPAIKTLKKQVEKELERISSRLSLHDFRLVAGPTHTNVIFDVVIPYQFEKSDGEVVRELEEFMDRLEGHSYRAVIHVDHSYIGEAPVKKKAEEESSGTGVEK